MDWLGHLLFLGGCFLLGLYIGVMSYPHDPKHCIFCAWNRFWSKLFRRLAVFLEREESRYKIGK